MSGNGLFVYILLYILNAKFAPSISQNLKVGKFNEIFAWKQLTYKINGDILIEDRFAEDGVLNSKRKRSTDIHYGPEHEAEKIKNQRPKTAQQMISATEDESGRFYIQYNNVPMGVEKVDSRLFVAVPRRRYGIPSTLNYIDLIDDIGARSPALRPYPNPGDSTNLTSVYRTRADNCGRLWMVDTGLLELPVNPQQLQPPAIVVYDLSTNRQILRYVFKQADIPAANTPTGLASITVNIPDNNCADAYAYVPDLTTFGIIVYSLRENDSWRLSHSYFHFNPVAGNFNIAGQRFQWSDGIFSITLAGTGRCKTAYFHPMVSTHEFSVSTCVLHNRTASQDRNYWAMYNILGDRGENSQSTMHGYHPGTKVIFFADIGRDGVSCWNTELPLNAENVPILASHATLMSYPSDIHVTGNEVWVMTNTLPRFGYSTLDTNAYNFYVYRGYVEDLIHNTRCDRLNRNTNSN